MRTLEKTQTVVAAVVFLASGWLPGAVADPPERTDSKRYGIAVVDLGRVVTSHPKYQVLLKDVRDREQSCEEKIRALINDAQAIRQLSRAKRKAGTWTALDEKVEAEQLKTIEQLIAEERASARTSTDKLHDGRINEIINDVKSGIERYAKNHSLTVVFPYRARDLANANPRTSEHLKMVGCAPLFVAPETDITDDIIAGLIKR